MLICLEDLKMIDRISSNISSSQLSTPTRRETRIDASEELTITEQDISKEIRKKIDPNENTLKEIIKGMNDFLNPTHTSLKFEFHEKLNEYYITLVDDSTKEVVREIPPKKLLDFYAAMTEKIGLLVDRKI